MNQMVVILYFYFLYIPCEARDSKSWSNLSYPVPKPFVISTTFGLVSPKGKQDGSVQNNNKLVSKYGERENPSLRVSAPLHKLKKEDNRFYNFHNKSMKKLITSQPVNYKAPKINFYPVNCLAGTKCSAIIPGPRLYTPPPKNRTEQEIRGYLKRFGLENGFNYFDDETINSNGITDKYFREEKEQRDRARKRRGKKISSFYDYDNFWPGSEYRPYKGSKGTKENNLKTNIYKFSSKSSLNRNPNHMASWSKATPSTSHSLNRVNYSIDPNKYTDEIPFPSFSSYNPRPTTKRPYISHLKPENIWNHYSNSVIKKYDRNSNKWVKISNKTKRPGYNFMSENSNLPKIRPSQQGLGSGIPPQHTGTHMTALGVTDKYDHYGDEQEAYHWSEYRPTQSSHQNYYPQTSDRPSPSIHSTPSPSNSVSFPLNVLPPHLSHPVLVFSNEGSNNASSSNDSVVFNNTDDSLSHNDYTDYVDLTKIQNTNPSLATTQVATPATRVVYITAPTQAPSTNRGDVGGGEDGGGGGGVTSNAYAVMAAVGAGLIPASIAAILPVILGRRKKRRRRSLGDIEELRRFPLHLIPLPENSLHSSDPVLKFILR